MVSLKTRSFNLIIGEGEGIVNGGYKGDWNYRGGRGGPRHAGRGNRGGRGVGRGSRNYGKNRQQDPEYPDYPTEYTQVLFMLDIRILLPQ